MSYKVVVKDRKNVSHLCTSVTLVLSVTLVSTVRYMLSVSDSDPDTVLILSLTL